MRIPGTKVWRAFPELDRFSDTECERFVNRATVEHAASKTGALLLGVLSLGITIPILIWLATAAWSLFAKKYLGGYGRPGRDLVGDIATVVFTAGVALGSCLTMLIVRDRWLIKTITRKVHQAACAGCGYSLLGLESVHGVVTCPECNTPLHLRDAGLTEEDIMVRPAGSF